MTKWVLSISCTLDQMAVGVPLCREVGSAKPRMVDEPLQVVVEGTSMIVTMLGTDFSVTYQKQFGSPHLVLTHTSYRERARA